MKLPVPNRKTEKPRPPRARVGRWAGIFLQTLKSSKHVMLDHQGIDLAVKVVFNLLMLSPTHVGAIIGSIPCIRDMTDRPIKVAAILTAKPK